jgi:DNA-binding beta-propeller fold protein YncE
VDRAGDVYVIERSNCRVQVFDSQGKHIAKWGTEGDGDGQFWNPLEGGIALDDSGNIYVVDSVNCRVQVFDSEGKFLRKWGTRGDADGQFNRPLAIAIDNRSDKIYIADTNNCRIQVFDTKGNFLAKWGTYGAGDMDLIYPQGVAVSSSGEIYVCDTYNHRIKVYRSVSGGAVEPKNKKPTKWGYLKRTELYQNYPNPFNPETWIPYRLAEDADVTISIYGMSGQLVRTLELGPKPSGSYVGKSGAAYWNGRDENGESVASGVYFYAMEAGEASDLRKMTIIR